MNEKMDPSDAPLGAIWVRDDRIFGVRYVYIKVGPNLWHMQGRGVVRERDDEWLRDYAQPKENLA